MQKVLILDSEIAVRKVVTAGFRKTNYRLLQAQDLEQARAIVEREQPDLAVVELDLVLDPNANGDAKITSWRGLEHTILVFTSATAKAQGFDIAKTFGAVDFFGKPFSPIKLRHRIEELLQTKVGSLEADADNQLDQALLLEKTAESRNLPR